MELNCRLIPRDLLFFRDARPMEAADVGSGARWPWPSVLHEAMLSAFQERWPDHNPELEHDHHFTDDERKRGTTCRFGGLKTVGPFPLIDGRPALPAPADLTAEGEGDRKTYGIMQPADVPGRTDLPSPLQYPVARWSGPSKSTPGAWIPAEAMAAYLRGKTEDVKTWEAECVGAVERRIGIGLDRETGTTKEGAFYGAEYLRIRVDRGVQLAAGIECTNVVHSPAGRDTRDVFESWSKNGSAAVRFGGQGGVAAVEQLPAPLALPEPEISGKWVKWVLLTPAVFGKVPKADEPFHPGGWLPDWVTAADGCVQLRERPERRPGESRREWRGRFPKAPVGARLVAARVPKPAPFSGWSLIRGEAKATRLAVPAGAVYYFEADSEEEARRLVQLLHLQRRSGRFGEKGFGIGVCGTWDLRTRSFGNRN